MTIFKSNETAVPDFLRTEESFRSFVKFIIALVAIATLASMVSLAFATRMDKGRLINLAAYLLIVVLPWLTLKRSVRAAVAQLAVGLWLMNTSTVVIYAGVHSLNVLVYPFLIAFASWLLGARWLVVMTLATMAVIMALGVAEHLQLFTPTPRVSGLHSAISICIILGVIAALVFSAYRSFQKSLRHIAELNENLERKVTQRTADLESMQQALQLSREELLRSEARATISTLVASVSHELNTPLGVSLTVAGSLAEKADRFGRLVESNQLKRSSLVEFVENVHEASDLMQRNLTRAVELMKNFRQVANDQASERHREFDLADTVQDVLQTMSPVLRRSPYKVEVDVAPGIVMASYPGSLGQVVINLINNALLHAFVGRTKGVMRLSATRLNETHVQIQFADDGVGMTPEVQAQLFDVFFSTRLGEGGTGLGMSIVRNLVRHTLGGDLVVHSAPDAGTRIVMTLPLELPERLESLFGPLSG